MSEEVKRKRGRPLNGPARKNQVKILLSDEELDALKLACKEHHKTQSDIIRDGMRARINLLNFDDSIDI